MTERKDMSNEDPCLYFEAKLVPDLHTNIKKRLIAAICDLKQPCYMEVANRSAYINQTAYDGSH